MEEHEVQSSSGQAKWLGWGASMLVSLGCLCTCLVLVRSIGIFNTMFQGLGVELPGALKVPVAVNCLEPPRGTVAAAGVTTIAVSTSTARLAVADAPPEVAPITEVPPEIGIVAAGEAKPAVVIVAVLVFEELQPASLLMSVWLPLL